MTLRQKYIVWAWIAVVVAMGLFPPWIYRDLGLSQWDLIQGAGHDGVPFDRGYYGFLFASETHGHIDTWRLVLEWAPATIPAGVFYRWAAPPTGQKP